MELIFVSRRQRAMRKSLSGRSPVTLRLAVLVLVPLLAACGSGGGDDVSVQPGAGNGAETRAPAPSATPAFCGLEPGGQAARSDGQMSFPATTEYVGKPLEDARALAGSRKLTV